MIEGRKREKEKQNAKKQQQQQKITASTTVQQMETMVPPLIETMPKKQPVNNQIKAVASSSTKRKRDVSSREHRPHLVSSTSQLSIQPSAAKKVKKTTFIQSIPSDSISVNKNYPLPAYLKQSLHLIFQTLRRQLNCSLNKKDEQMFVHLRLQLFDRQFRLDIDRHLWQSYLDLGCREQLWLDELYRIAKTHEPEICQQYIVTQLVKIKDQLDQCNAELTRQAQSSIPILLPSLEILDSCLKEYVCLQQNYLFKPMDDQLIRCKAYIRDQQLYRQLSAYHLTTVQQEALQHIIQLRQAQLEVFEESVMLEQRILHQFLPPNFDQLEYSIAVDLYWPRIADRTLVEIKIKRRKILQFAKRCILNIFFHAYESKYEEYEQQYQQALNEFELRFANTIMIDGLTLFHAIQAYMIHRTDRIIQEIYHKIASFREIIAQRRQRSSSAKKTVGVSPEVTVDVLHVPLSAADLVYLSQGESYIRPNQSALRPYKQRESQIRNEHKTIMANVTNQLTNYCRRKPPEPMLKRFSELLENRLHLRFMAPVSFVDQMRAQREYEQAKSIREKLRKGKLILRMCDKGGGLHLSAKNDYERKAAEYRQETKAYGELSDNPLEEMLMNVISTLEDLKKKGQLSKYYYNQLLPKEESVKLSYMYFNPKAHKEGTPPRPIMNTIQAVTRAISSFLDKLILPIYNEYNKKNTIIDGLLFCKEG